MVYSSILWLLWKCSYLHWFFLEGIFFDIVFPTFISPSFSHATVHWAIGVCSGGLERKPLTTCGWKRVYRCLPPGIWRHSWHSQGCPHDQSKSFCFFSPSLIQKNTWFSAMSLKSIFFILNDGIISSLFCVKPGLWELHFLSRAWTQSWLSGVKLLHFRICFHVYRRLYLQHDLPLITLRSCNSLKATQIQYKG